MSASSIGKTAGPSWADKPYSDRKEEAVSMLTPEQKKMIGDQDIGSVLNKASDPNWIDPSKQVKGKGNANLDKDAFFKLMLTQLKNQDPMNPLQNHEMAAQLAQFSTLEQMSNMNSTLTKIEGKNAQPENFQALNLIGKTVAGDSSKIVRTQFDKIHDFNFVSPTDLTEAKIKVLNEKGEAVREYKLNNLQAGTNKITWNGMNESGVNQGAGEYKFTVEAKDKLGQRVNIKTDFEGKISGLSFSAEGPVLQVGAQSIKMKDVRQITDSSVKNNDQNVTDVTNLDLNKANAPKQNLIKQEANTSANTAAQPQGGSVQNDVAMSRELMNQLQKEMK